MAGPYRYQHGDKPLEGYTILRGIGRGGFGEVYYSRSDGGREVALKVIQQNHDIELRGVGHCINLKSPHLISIFDVKKNADGVPFVIMEYVAGPSLRELLPKGGGGMPKEKAAYLLREMAKGLTYLHERGIVHRDLKPENIFWEDGYVKIGDYGLSKYISVTRHSGQTISVGTVHYMAPEIGSGSYHQGIDIYALGVIFYELLTGTVPFNGDSMGEILMKHLTCEPDVSVLEPHFRPILRKALAKSPAERYQSSPEMLKDVLDDPVLAELVSRVDPQGFTPSAAATSIRALETTPVPRAVPAFDMPPGPRAQPAAPAMGPSPQEDSLRRSRFRRQMAQRIVPGIGTAIAMALVLALFNRRGIAMPNAITGYFLFLSVVASVILFVNRWFSDRFQITSGVSRRLVTLGLAGPVLFAAIVTFAPLLSSNGPIQESLLGLLASLLFVDWHARCQPERQEQTSIGMAVSAGIFGLAAAAVTKGQMIPGFCIPAALSLIVNAVSPYIPASERKRSKRGPRASGMDGGGSEAQRGRDAKAPPANQFAVTPDGPTLPVGPLMNPAMALAPARGRLETGVPAGRTMLVRPREGSMVGGVCAGIAARYAYDVVWVRLLFLVVAIASTGFGLIPYIFLWISMPREAATSPKPRALPPPRRRGTPGRLFWYGLGATFFAGGAVLVFSAPMNARNMTTWLILNGLGVVALVLGRPRGTSVPAGAPGSNGLSGWAAFGSVLVGLGAGTGLLHGLLVTGLAFEVFREAGLEYPLWIRSGEIVEGLQWIAVANFVLGCICVVIARGRGGAGHVVRGVLGWSVAMVVLGFVFLNLHPLVRVEPGFQFQSAASFGVWILMALGFLLSAVLLLWPARHARPVEQAPLLAAGEPTA